MKVKPVDVPLNLQASGVSMHTTVSPQDIANVALFLATEPGKHISGQAISVCGGARYLV